MTATLDVRSDPTEAARDEILEFLATGTPEEDLRIRSDLHPQSWLPLARIEHDGVLERTDTTEDGQTWRVDFRVTDRTKSEPIEFDVRELPPEARHDVLIETFDRLSPDQAFVLVNDHDPKPLFYELRSMHGDRIEWGYLRRESGAWEVKIGKTEATASVDSDVTASFDVRQIPKQDRHPTIHHRFNGLAAGDVLEVIAPHEPRHLKQEFDHQYGAFDWTVTDKNANRCVVRITKGQSRADDHSAASADRSSEELAVTEELDVRELPPAKRHETIFDAYRELSVGEAFVLINDHDPKPLYHQFNAEAGDQFQWEYQQQKPGDFRVLIGKEDTEDSETPDSGTEPPF